MGFLHSLRFAGGHAIIKRDILYDSLAPSLISEQEQYASRRIQEVAAMQEDVLGTRKTAFPVTYVQCARCGKLTPRSQASLVPSNALAEERSEYEYLCQTCQAELASGEKDLSMSNG
jgi:NMD protein affecting ribosome stability and mRNA decay